MQPHPIPEPFHVAVLTGAGLTKKFGGLLASEMWAAFYNQPEMDQFPAVKKELQANLDFEAVYEDLLLNKGLEERERQAAALALLRAYEEMDSQLVERGNPVSKAAACSQNFLKYFVQVPDNSEGRAYFFTLNQDLLIERFWSAEPSFEIPGIHKFSLAKEKKLERNNFISLPDRSDLDEAIESFVTRKCCDKFAYVKLHGSHGWSGSEHNAMVVGKSKDGMIKREPLLNWYFSLFENVLESIGHLVVIGYGFRGAHINKAIVEHGMKNGKLKLSVLLPLVPEAFHDLLCSSKTGAPYGKELWKRLFHYETGMVTDLYDDQSRQPSERMKKFFGRLDLPGFS